MRWRDGWLWLHNSGEGQFGYVDMDKGAFVPAAFCPGYLRGLAFMREIAVVGMSLPRDNKTFSGLKLNEEPSFTMCACGPASASPPRSAPPRKRSGGPSRSPTSKARAETRGRFYSPRGR